MVMELGPPGDLVRVRWIDEDQRRVTLDLRTGQTAALNSESPLDWEVGAVLLMTREGSQPSCEAMPAELWPEESWVGVVRLHLSDVVVVDISGRWRLVPTNGAECRVGNTVEGRDSVGVVRVLSQDPIRYLDLPDIDDTVVDGFVFSGNKVSFDDFAGLDNMKARARELIETPLRHHEDLAAIGARPIKGVLFTGPPGTGKTMLARIIASATDAVFYEISGPTIFSKWYGKSEKILRALFEHAARQPRSIIFFDEIDSIAEDYFGGHARVRPRVDARLRQAKDTKSVINSRSESTQTQGTQVLRKATVQATFRDLYEHEKGGFLLTPTTDAPPDLRDSRDVNVALERCRKDRWATPVSDLARGKLTEIEVELDVEDIFRVAAVIGNFLEAPELLGPDVREQLQDALSANAVINKLFGEPGPCAVSCFASGPTAVSASRLATASTR
jgi:DNA polymerase III delta prime subunit